MLQLKNSFSVLSTLVAITTSLLILSGEGQPLGKSRSVGEIAERAAHSGCINGESVAHINADLPVHPDGSLIKEPGVDAVYVIAGGKKSLVPSIDRVRALYGNGGFELSDVVTVSSDELRNYINGPEVTNVLSATPDSRTEPPGRLIRPLGGSANPQEIAMVTAAGGRLVFQSYSVFHDLGFQACKVKAITDYDSYAVEGLIDGTGASSLTDDFSIGIDPPLDTVEPGDAVDLKITTSSLSGRPHPITLRVDGLPSGATYLLSSNPVTSGNTAILHISTSTSTPLASCLITITGTASRMHQQSLTLNVTDASQGELTVSTSLALTPEGPYTVGQTLTAAFSMTNRATKKVKIGTLLARGRLNGDTSCADDCPDFSTIGPIKVKPGKSVSYTATQTITRAGDYVFLVAYKEKGKDWITNVAVDPGVRNSLNVSVNSAGTGNPVISTTSPASPIASVGNQPITVFGSNFEPGLDVSVTLPNGQSAKLTGAAQIQNVHPGSFVMVIDFNGVPGRYNIQVNNPAAHQSNAYSFNAEAEAAAPVVNQITTAPNPPIVGQAFTITLTGSNFSASNSTVFFSGRGCTPSPCSIGATGSGAQVSGQALLASGVFTVTLRNNTTGLTSAGVSLAVSNAAAAPVINQVSTSPNFPLAGQAFTITLTGSNFDPSSSIRSALIR